MAPLARLTTQILLSLGIFDPKPQKKSCQNSENHQLGTPGSYGASYLSTVSWGYNRMDIFGMNGLTQNVSHKWYDGYQWNPDSDEPESLGGHGFSRPKAVSWGKDRTDIFAVGDRALYHKFWDGHSWQPAETDWESVGWGLLNQPLAVTTWGVDRLDIFGITFDKQLCHKYWDGSSWSPGDDSFEILASDITFIFGVAAVSWGPNRIDIFGIGEEFQLLHIYWDGSQWSKIEDFEGTFITLPTVISWGENRLDVFIVDADGELYHKYWDGYQWSGYENLGHLGHEESGRLEISSQVAATSWGENRLDIVAMDEDNRYFYKYWSGSQWYPSVKGWYPKQGDFQSPPSIVSWGENRLDIFGVDTQDQLAHQTWYGSGWYPEVDKWEQLGGPWSD